MLFFCPRISNVGISEKAQLIKLIYSSRFYKSLDESIS